MDIDEYFCRGGELGMSQGPID